MEKVRFNEYELSRLVIGTVQFGMPYGIANRTGQPDYAHVRSLLAAAAEVGVNCIDTAAAYGTSEEVLGQAMQELRLADHMVVVTKVRQLKAEEHAAPATAAKVVRESVEQSLRRLRLDRIPVVLFHNVTDFVCMDTLEELKRRGLVGHVGVSCDDRPGPAGEIIASGRAEAVQLPASIVDRRHASAGNFLGAADRSMAVFIRSIYLQGLLLMPEETVPNSLRPVLPVRRRLAELAGRAGMTLGEMAMRYMLSQDGVSCVIAGVENLAQLRENVAICNRGRLEVGLLQAIERESPDLPAEVITPNLWPRDSRKA